MKRILLILSIAVMFFSFIGADPDARTVIGSNLPLTAKIGTSIGLETKNAAEMILEQVNAQGGLEVQGRRHILRFVYVDNQLDPEQASIAARRLVEKEKVLALIGPQGSGRAIPAGEVCNDGKTPMVSPWSTNPATTQNRPYVFRACFIDPFKALAASRFTKEKFAVNKIAILYNQEGDYSETLAKLYRYSWNTNYGDVAAKIVPQAKSLGWDKPIMGADAWGAADLWNLSDGPVAGCCFTTRYAAAGAVGKTKEFIDAYSAKYGYVPDDVAALSCDAVNIVPQSIQNAGLTGNLARDRENLRAAIASLKNFDGITGKISRFDNEGDPVKEVMVVKINSGGGFVYEAAVQPGR
ncbi:MAG: ABC transporter substrate-binding protein [Spirochaetaceae bacterium]|jgi:branched-chain amino acid transport system substrate-binding protein|nr:ABC transporter substrate-binding protein [Spirochaetaceae bacterium]